MKTYTRNLYLILLGAMVAFVSCDDDDTPPPINEEEVITTLTVTLLPQGGGGAPIILQSRDLDGDGPNPPVVTVSGSLTSGQDYDGSIVLLNETESPAEDITEEIEEEDEDHQFFFITGGNLDVTTAYTDQDGNGQPIGLSFSSAAGVPSTGTFTVVLRHEPDKDGAGVSDGDITNAGGETDISVDFQLEVI